jgi:hypothetical protein
MEMQRLALPAIVTVLYCLAKYVEEIYLEDCGAVAVKHIVREGMLVFLATFVTHMVLVHSEDAMNQIMNMITETKSVIPPGEAQIFTDSPGF